MKNNTLKVGCTGPSGSGKTTLARKLAKATNTPFGYWGSRYSAALLGFALPYHADEANLDVYIDYRTSGADPETAALNAMSAHKYKPGATCRELFQKTLRSAKHDHETSLPAFISDRSYLDDYAYSALAGSKGDRCLAIFDTAAIYDVLFHMPSRRFQDIDGDPSRRDDPEYHAQFEAEIEKLIDRVKAQRETCHVIELTEHGKTDVLHEALNHLQRLGLHVAG